LGDGRKFDFIKLIDERDPTVVANAGL